jgi:hypothetical protein
MIRINNENWVVVTPWHNEDQQQAFLDAWSGRNHLMMLRDSEKCGCAVMKNRCIAKAVEDGADGVVVLDDDCFPDVNGPQSFEELIVLHVETLKPQPVEMSIEVTYPPSRGTPYHCRNIEMPVAASMGFWTEVGDYDAVAQLVHGPTYPMRFDTRPVFGRYFPLCGMNLAFRPKQWMPWCGFINVPRFDDIWMGWLFQKKAYAENHCFNLAGPLVRHSRQSNVWANLRDEAVHLEANDTLWRDIAMHPSLDYSELRRLLPV